ncbi:hypothetical protein EBZ39_16690 [bacterium]|nr:hypothetical protein [bacterium]
MALDSNSLSALENVTVTVGAAITGTVTVSNFPASQAVTFSAVTISNFPASQAVSLASVPTHGVTLASTTVTVSSLPAISGTVTAMAGTNFANEIYNGIFNFSENDQLGVYVTSALPAGSNNIGRMTIDAGTNRIGVVTIGGGTVTIGAGTAQIGSVTASISGTVPVSGTFWQATQPVSGTFWQATQPVSLTSTTVTVSSIPALAAGTAQIGSVTAFISGTVPVSGTFWPETQPVSLAATTVTISANPSGPLTTRFGSVTTANTSQLTAAVTNTAREYLFIQNISTGIVTVGIGFPSTTTQGIQLSPGSGMTFDSFCPTGAVWWLGATTGATWTILEG